MAEPKLTLKEAAAATGVSFSTIKRRRAGGDFPNAAQDKSGAWRVSVSDLIGAGLELVRGGSRPNPWPSPEPPVNQVHDPGQNGDELTHAQASIAQLTAELADVRTAWKVAEAQAAAYARNLDDLRRAAETQTLALRALTGPPADHDGHDGDGGHHHDGGDNDAHHADHVLHAVPSAATTTATQPESVWQRWFRRRT